MKGELERIDLAGSIPFISVHLCCFLVFFTGISWASLAVCLLLYFVRMFGITAGYHRYFSHRSYKTSRWFQFCLALLGCSSAQLGPLWWAAHHRHHHRFSDESLDVHSPVIRSIFWAHMGWILCKKYMPTRFDLIADFGKYPELRFLNRFAVLPVILLATAVFSLGCFLEKAQPSLHTSAWQMLTVGFFWSTVLLYHGTFTINSLAHRWGTRRFETTDDSRNNLLLALITLGEGWHNNHHQFPFSERQGFYWWEIDLSHYSLKLLSKLGVVWDLKAPPGPLWK